MGIAVRLQSEIEIDAAEGWCANDGSVTATRRAEECFRRSSISFADESLSRALEPRASSPATRFETLRRLSEFGIRTGVAIAPVIPGLSDAQIPEILARATSRRAVLVRHPAAAAGRSAAGVRRTPARGAAAARRQGAQRDPRDSRRPDARRPIRRAHARRGPAFEGRRRPVRAALPAARLRASRGSIGPARPRGARAHALRRRLGPQRRSRARRYETRFRSSFSLMMPTPRA